MELTDVREWPERLQGLARAFGGPDRARARGDFWIILNLALAQRLRLLYGRFQRVDSDRIRDLASEKALDLVGKIDRGQWNPLESTPGELVSFLSTVARNALVDEVRGSKRVDLRPSETLDALPGEVGRDVSAQGVEREEFVAQLVSCADGLAPRSRVIWLLRVLYELSSRTIAQHPEVLLKSSHVDVILARCRDQIRKCMKARGLEASSLPPGTFAELWLRFRGPTLMMEVPDD
jgi:RNA polymerase sigma factor (sigma-70 family)